MAAETRSLTDISSAVVDKEAGLHRQLSSRQVAMIAIGGAIGTGLFLGSSLAVRTAGPAVILTFVLGAIITLLLMGALSEMSVAHPTAGSFGVHAEIYLGRWAGFVVRYTYWAVQAISISRSMAGQCYTSGVPGTRVVIFWELFRKLAKKQQTGALMCS